MLRPTTRRFALFAAALTLFLPAMNSRAALPANPNATVAAKPLAWLNSYQIALVQQQKNDRLILMYFAGTGWDDYTTELDAQVFNTAPFTTWAEANVIPMKIDFPDPAGTQKQAAWLKTQNENLRLKFNISKVPTFLFVDAAGDVQARVGYDTARLRKEEEKGHPNAWVEFCDKIVKDKVPTQYLIAQKNLSEGVAFARKHGIPLLLFINQGTNEPLAKEKEAVMKHPAFIKFVNHNMAFLDVKWPEETDTTPAAKEMKAFAAQWKFGPAPLEIVVWSPGGLGEMKDQITSVSVQNVLPLIKKLDSDLPRIDYNGDWIEDYRMAQAIAHQEKKDMFISFGQSDDQSWTSKWDQEVYQTPEFRKFAKENFVLLKVNFPKSTTQPAALAEQNRMLADMYAIRGFPTMVILNPLGQKIGDAHYMKGGAPTFITTLNKLRQADHDRRVLPSEEAAKGK